MGEHKPNYPRNCWWVAASADEIASPLGRRLLDDPVVVFRRADGTVAALEDRCIHRWAPLSAGRVVGETIVCPYHGARFAADGTCVRVPTQNNVPPQARVRSYPVVERHGYIWIWMGDAGRADAGDIPPLDFSDAPGWHTVGGAMIVAANYFLVQENVLDLTHFGFLHADTLEQGGWEQGVSEVVADDRSVGYHKVIAPEPLAPFLSVPLGVAAGEPAGRIDWGRLIAPGVHVAGIDFAPGQSVTGEVDAPYHFRIAHLTTPVSPSSSHYWWIIGIDFGDGSPATATSIRSIIGPTFDQDKHILERIQQTIDGDRHATRALEVSFVADRAGLLARRLLQKRLASDQP